ncbi:MAG TPA: HD domain-containing protein [Anaerolineae bacterium]|nr:HD domain-containing protein [Anaerolineae bacterium]
MSDLNQQAQQMEKAIIIAVRAHENQRQRDGTPYILHPLFLMSQMYDHPTRMAALLHDVVEDTAYTLEQLQSELDLDDDITTAIRLLTHEEDVSYEDYLTRLKPNPIARQVKLADLKHNMDVRRLNIVAPRDQVRLERYRRSWWYLMQP